MENERKDIFETPSQDDTQDLGFLAETSVLEKLAEGENKPEEQNLSETQVFEKLTESETKPAEKEKQNKKDSTKKESFRSSALREVLLFFRDLAVSLAAVLLIVNFVLRPIQVKGSSMYPNLIDGSFGVSNLLGYNMDGVRRFDIVIIHEDSKNEYLVKRCVGLPGETVSYRNGILYINGEPMEEEFLDTEYRDTYDGEFMEDVEEITLGENEYYCLGDNRPRSTDSRYYGPFEKDQIVSKGAFILFPFSAFGAASW